MSPIARLLSPAVEEEGRGKGGGGEEDEAEGEEAIVTDKEGGSPRLIRSLDNALLSTADCKDEAREFAEPGGEEGDVATVVSTLIMLEGDRSFLVLLRGLATSVTLMIATRVERFSSPRANLAIDCR